MKNQKDLDKINEHLWSFIGQVRCARTFWSLSTKSEYMHHNDAVDYANGFIKYAVDNDLMYLHEHKDYIHDNHPELFKLMDMSLSILVDLLEQLKVEMDDCYPNHKAERFHIK